MSAVRESFAESRGGAFQLEFRGATGTAKVDDGSIARKRIEVIRGAARTIEFAFGPRFTGNACALRGAGVAGKTFGGQGEVQEGIRSRSLQGLKPDSSEHHNAGAKAPTT